MNSLYRSVDVSIFRIYSIFRPPVVIHNVLRLKRTYSVTHACILQLTWLIVRLQVRFHRCFKHYNLFHDVGDARCGWSHTASRRTGRRFRVSGESSLSLSPSKGDINVSLLSTGCRTDCSGYWRSLLSVLPCRSRWGETKPGLPLEY